jgi:hypothetical protein
MKENWLQRRVVFEEEVDRLSRLPLADPGRTVSEFRLWYCERFRIGDELWWYDTGMWEEAAGENGYALVRNGGIAFMYPCMRN